MLIIINITKLNKIGFSLSEDVAFEEYIEIFNLSRFHVKFKRMSPANLLFEFIMVTLQSIVINVDSINAFTEFTVYFTKSHKAVYETAWCIRTLFYIILRNVNYSLSYIYDDSYQGNNLRTTLIYIQGLPWMKVNSEVFNKFLHYNFPDLSNHSINEIIQSLNDISDNNGQRRDFSKWSNLLPFLNGVLDFSYFDVKNSDKKSEKEICNRQNVNTKSKLPKDICNNSRRGTFSLDYLETIKNSYENVNKKDYKNGLLLKEDIDDQYQGFDHWTLNF